MLSVNTTVRRASTNSASSRLRVETMAMRCRKDVPREKILYAGYGTCTASIWVQLPHTEMKETVNAKNFIFRLIVESDRSIRSRRSIALIRYRDDDEDEDDVVL